MKTSPSPELAYLGPRYEDAARAYTVAVCTAGGGTVYAAEDFTLTILPAAHGVSGVISPHFSEDRVDERIEAALALARRHGEEVRFKLGPTSSPGDLARRLEARGLKRGASLKYYGMDLSAHLPHMPVPDGLRIYPVDDFDALLYEPHPFYGAKASARKRALLAAFARLSQQAPQRLFAFVSEMHGHFAGMGVTFIHDDVVVGYDFAIVKALRRQGIGAAMLLAMGQNAIRQGARCAALLASTDGLKFYPHFGFRPVGVYPTFVYNKVMQKKDETAR